MSGVLEEFEMGKDYAEIAENLTFPPLDDLEHGATPPALQIPVLPTLPVSDYNFTYSDGVDYPSTLTPLSWPCIFPLAFMTCFLVAWIFKERYWFIIEYVSDLFVSGDNSEKNTLATNINHVARDPENSAKLLRTSKNRTDLSDILEEPDTLSAYHHPICPEGYFTLYSYLTQSIAKKCMAHFKPTARLTTVSIKDHHQHRIREWIEQNVNKQLLRMEEQDSGESSGIMSRVEDSSESFRSNDEATFLRLSTEYTRFDPVSNVNRVFFDNDREQLFAIRSGGVTGVVVKGPTPETSTSFTMDDRGDILSVKFNSDQTILAIQRSNKSVEFINNPSDPQADKFEYSQACKTKSANLIGFSWSGFGNDIIFVTDQSVELYEVQANKKSLRYIKLYTMQTNWFIYQPRTRYLLVSSGILGNVLHPVFFSGQGMCTRHSRFEVDLPIVPKPPRLCLLERDVSMVKLYEKSRVVVLRHKVPPQGGQVNPGAAEIVIYTIDGGTPRKTNILKLDMSGRFAINFIDNLVIVHHQSSKTSQLFDIGLDGITDSNVMYHSPIVNPASISCEQDHRLYSPNWVVFQPNIIIDAKVGIMWRLNFELYELARRITNPELQIDIILLRKDSRHELLESLKAILHDRPPIPIVTSLMKKISNLENISSNLAKYVLLPLSKNADDAYLFAVMVEHTRTKEVVDDAVRDLMVVNLIKRQKCYQLHQFLQYHILSDNKKLAFHLLSLSEQYPPAQQLALDMLYRVGCDRDDIIDNLLSQGKVIAALKVVQSQGSQDVVSARKFLEAAKQAQDPSIFYSVYRFFVQRNLSLRNSPHFPKGEMCLPYVTHFKSLFGENADGVSEDRNEL